MADLEDGCLGCAEEGRKEVKESEGEGKNIYLQGRKFLGSEDSRSGLVKTKFFSVTSLLVGFDMKNE